MSELIAQVEVGGRIIVKNNGVPVANLEITRGEQVANGNRLIIHAMAVDSDAEYTDLTLTARSITLGVVPGGNPANGHIYFLTMGEADLVIAPDKPLRVRPTGAGFIDLWPQDTQGTVNNMEVGDQVPRPGKFTNLAATGKFSCNGGTATGQIDVGPPVTDLASMITAWNSFRAALRIRGDLA